MNPCFLGWVGAIPYPLSPIPRPSDLPPHMPRRPSLAPQDPLHYPHSTKFMAPGPLGLVHPIPEDPSLRQEMAKVAQNYAAIYRKYNFDWDPEPGSIQYKIDQRIRRVRLSCVILPYMVLPYMVTVCVYRGSRVLRLLSVPLRWCCWLLSPLGCRHALVACCLFRLS
jgi:hypothetical protein